MRILEDIERIVFTDKKQDKQDRKRQDKQDKRKMIFLKQS